MPGEIPGNGKCRRKRTAVLFRASGGTVMVKRRGKSPPAERRKAAAQGKPSSEQDQIGNPIPAARRVGAQKVPVGSGLIAQMNDRTRKGNRIRLIRRVSLQERFFKALKRFSGTQNRNRRNRTNTKAPAEPRLFIFPLDWLGRLDSNQRPID